MEIKLNAVALKSVDYKDNDKMLTLFSLEQGKIGAGVRGVKKAGAKLGFCVQPFCFAEYVLSVNGERATVVGATELESFYKIRLNPRAFYAGSGILEYLLKVCETNAPDEKLFFLAINSLKTLNFGEKSPECVLAEFLFNALYLSGYGISGVTCAGCDKTAGEFERAYFDFESGELYCENCRTEKMREIMPVTAQAIAFLNDKKEILPESALYALKFLSFYIKLKVGENLKSVDELVKFVELTTV